MEDLNKNQIVLLTLLVSFVTSIATGIMTVSLLSVAPVEITRNINSIVEKTIEKVTPANPLSPSKEVTTVIVKEEDSITNAINQNLKSIVRIEEKDGILSGTSFYGIGLVVNKDGSMITNRKTITSGNVYTAVMSDGTELKLIPMGVDKKTDSLVFKANPAEVAKTASSSPTKTPYVFVPAVFAPGEPRLGQTVIGLGGDTLNAVAVGRIVSLQMKETGVGTTTTQYLANIDTDLSTKDLVEGSPVFNISGEIVGMKLTSETVRSFIPASILKKELTTLTEVPKIP